MTMMTLFTIAMLLLTVTTTLTHADVTDIYGTYESVFLRNMYATNKAITPDQKEAYERMRVSIIINENNVEMLFGGNNNEPHKMDYYIIKNDFILAYDDTLLNVMYYPIYFKNNIIYTMGQSFVKNKSNKEIKLGQPPASVAR